VNGDEGSTATIPTRSSRSRYCERELRGERRLARARRAGDPDALRPAQVGVQPFSTSCEQRLEAGLRAVLHHDRDRAPASASPSNHSVGSLRPRRFPLRALRVPCGADSFQNDTGTDTRVLVFDIGVTDWNSTESTSFRSGDYAAGLIATAIQAVVRPAAARGATDLILQGVPNPNLETSVRRHRYGFGTAGAMAGGAAGFFGASALAVTGAVLAAPALLGAAALGAAGAGMIRGAHNWARRRDQRSIERLADEVAGFTRVRLHLGEPDVRRIEGEL
jgi:hypothetical protein